MKASIHDYDKKLLTLILVGQKYAMMEMKIVLATFFKHYKVKSLSRREDVKVILDTLGRADGGIWVQLHKRRPVVS